MEVCVRDVQDESDYVIRKSLQEKEGSVNFFF